MIVIDTVPADLAELVGYLQDMTSDRLNLDLVTVTAYEVGDRRVLVPQLVEPDRQAFPATAPTTPHGSVITKDPEVFAKAIQESPAEHRPSYSASTTWTWSSRPTAWRSSTAHKGRAAGCSTPDSPVRSAVW